MQSTEVTIKGQKYKIDQMTPFVAGRVYGWLKGAAIKFARDDNGQSNGFDRQAVVKPEEQKELADGSVKFTWTIAPSAISEEACEKIQKYALQSCWYFDASTSAPCQMLVGGNVAAPFLKDDAPGVDELVLKSLQYSISPFFLKELLEMQSAAPTTAQ